MFVIKERTKFELADRFAKYGSYMILTMRFLQTALHGQGAVSR